MKIKKMVRKKLAIIIAIVVILILAGVLIYNYYKQWVLLASLCTDTDGGRNYYVKGTVTTDITCNQTTLKGAAIGVNYDCTRDGKFCSSGAGISPGVFEPSCNEVYDGTNVKSDANTFNLVFIGNGFKNTDDLKAAAKRVINLDGTSKIQTLSDGFMQIPVFKNNQNRFNFWYVPSTKPFSSKDPQTVWNELYNFDLVSVCQDMLPNRVIPVFIYPGQGNGVGYPYASYGRYYVTLFDCIDSESTCLGGDYPNLQNGNIHELLHTVPCLGDEYGAWGNNPQGSMQSVEFNSVLIGNANLQFFVGDYKDCMANAPWVKDGYFGNGCGNNGVVDCFDNSKCNQPISYVNGVDTQPGCCLSGKDCTMEIGCFEGGLYSDKGIWRSSSGGVMRNPYVGKISGEAFLNEWDQEIVSRVIQKGPAIGKVWQEGQNYNLDCDGVTSSILCGDGICEVGENCPGDVSSCADNICYEPTCINGCGEVPVTNGENDEACLASDNKICDSNFGCSLDTDNDGIIEIKDNCPSISNPLQEDSDTDNVGNLCDICHETSLESSVDTKISNNGCILPKFTKFSPGLTTDFENVEDLRSVSSFWLGIDGKGKIIFSDKLLNLEGLDFDSYVNIEDKRISIDSNNLPVLNEPAVLNFYNIDFITPGIKRNGQTCSDCVEISYLSGIYAVEVSSFSEYEIVETYVQPSSTGTGSGGSGGGGTTTPRINATPLLQCMTNWQCSEWQLNAEGTQKTRACNDANNCGVTIDEPIEQESVSCNEKWVCDRWSLPDFGDVQRMECIDINACGTEKDKPLTEKSLSKKVYYSIVGIIALLIVTVVVVLIKVKRKNIGSLKK